MKKNLENIHTKRGYCKSYYPRNTNFNTFILILWKNGILTVGMTRSAMIALVEEFCVMKQEEECEDTKGVIRICISKQDNRQHNDQK